MRLSAPRPRAQIFRRLFHFSSPPASPRVSRNARKVARDARLAAGMFVNRKIGRGRARDSRNDSRTHTRPTSLRRRRRRRWSGANVAESGSNLGRSLRAATTRREDAGPARKPASSRAATLGHVREGPIVRLSFSGRPRALPSGTSVASARRRNKRSGGGSRLSAATTSRYWPARVT